jgi:hypothetical protein
LDDLPVPSWHAGSLLDFHAVHSFGVLFHPSPCMDGNTTWFSVEAPFRCSHLSV